MAGPTKDELMKIKCPEDRPYLCLPYGSCCKPDEYCSRQSNACESCFPEYLQNDPTNLLSWCRSIGQYNSSGMPDASCSLACSARFNSSVLSDSCNDSAHATRCNTTADWCKPNVISTDPSFAVDELHIILFCLYVPLIAALLYYYWKSTRSQKSVGQENEIEKQSGQEAINLKSQSQKSHANDEENVSGEVAKKDLKLDDKALQSTIALRAPAELEREPLLGEGIETTRNINDRSEMSMTSSDSGNDSLSQDSPISTSRNPPSAGEGDRRQNANNSNDESQEHPAIVEQRNQRKHHSPTTAPDEHHKAELVTSHSEYKPKTDSL